MMEHGQLLLDIFVNYDCDIQGVNLYERMVRALVKLALGNRYLSSDPNGGALSAPQVRAYASTACHLTLLMRTTAHRRHPLYPPHRLLSDRTLLISSSSEFYYPSLRSRTSAWRPSAAWSA
jgi:hypothetical protein